MTALSWLHHRVLESSLVHVDEEAAEYDAMVRRHGWLLNEPFVALAARCGLERGRVLDIGTGPGWVPIGLARRQPQWDIHAVDASADMLARGAAHAAVAGVGARIQFVPGDATALPFPDGSFDLVVSNFLLHHLAEPVQLLDEAARVLKPGGRVLIKDLRRQPAWKAAVLLGFSRHVLRYSPAQLRMYQESMAAALTPAEARAAVRQSRLHGATVRGFRGLDFVITT